MEGKWENVEYGNGGGCKCGRKMKRGEHWREESREERREERGEGVVLIGQGGETQGTHQPDRATEWPSGCEREMEAAVCFQRGSTIPPSVVSTRLGDREMARERQTARAGRVRRA